MSDDWGWFFTSAEGRANILRDEVASLGSQLSSANRTSSRLSSQLATLSGSIETRLTALSAAFDAYVELGDVREQLAGHPDTSAVRREVLAALETLAAGRSPEPVDARELPYWLPYAMNAVAAVAAGRPDPVAEAEATRLSPAAELFIVATCGVLGHGPAVASRVPALLVCDGTLSPSQVALWTAAYTGVFGPVLSAVQPQWAESLDVAGRRIDWASWARQQADGGTGEALRWLAGRTGAPVAAAPSTTSPGGPDGPPVAATDGPAAAREGLRAVVVPLINEGLGDEVALLDRARELRRRIEDPASIGPADTTGREAPIPSAPSADEDAKEVETRSVAAQVRRAFVAVPIGSDEHRILLSWIRPGLDSAVAELVQQVQAPVDTSATVSGGGRSVVVTSAGADQAQLAHATQTIRDNWVVAPTAQYVGFGAAAALAVGALLLVVVDNPVAAFLVLVLALAAGGYGLYQRRLRAQADEQADGQVHELTVGVQTQQQRCLEREASLRSERQQQLDLGERVRRDLTEVTTPTS